MKQSRTAPAAFDLDDLERELTKAAAPRNAAGASAPQDDPLSELARIVSQDAGPARKAGVDPFEAFLAATAAAGPSAAAQKSPRIEPLFPAGLPDPQPLPEVAAQPVEIPFPPISAAETAPTLDPRPAPAFVDPLEQLLAQDLGLRSGLDDLPAKSIRMPEAAIEPEKAIDEPVVVDVPPANVKPVEVLAEAQGPTKEDAPELAAAVSIVDAPTEPKSKPQEPFDDMLAEFEAAMRDSAAESVRSRSAEGQPIIVPSQDAIVVPPPIAPAIPEPPRFSADSAVIGAGAAAAAATVAISRKPRRGMLLAGGVITVAVIGLGALAITGGGKSSRPSNGTVPVIEAKGGVTKERPANPGGVEVPNQDKEILQPRAADASRPERVVPREEQPVDLTQAQRQAAAAAPGVRQIPVSPPPAGGVIPVPETTARPVASVPIVIGAAPPVSLAPPPALTPPPVTPAPAAVAPVASAPAPVAPAAPLPSAAPASPPTTAGVPARPAVTTPPAATQQQAAAQPPAEPRRVRAVPIRPENGEAIPQRAQPTPRVVPPAASAASDPNAPLSISPQANRGGPIQPAAPRQAAVQPSATVPSSVPSLSEPATTSASAQPNRSTGGSFAVQLAAEGSEDAARAKFNRMRSQYGSVLGSSSPSIRSAEVNGRNVFRVRVGDMSREEAVSMCERLKASGGSCFVARN